MLTRRDFVLALGLAPASVLLRANAHAEPPAAMDRSGWIFGPGPDGGCDDLKVGLGVTRIDPKTGDYLFWYCARDKGFDPAIGRSFLSARVGLARSRDGVHFERVRGKGELGCVFGPSGRAEDFDAETVAVVDVQRMADEWWLYYLGTNAVPRETPYGTVRGARMLSGVARSADGVSWTRMPGKAPGGALLSNIDGYLFTAWPNGFHADGKYYLYVTASTAQLKYFPTYYATSANGVEWDLQGKLEWRDGVRPWEAAGVMTRSIQNNPYPNGKRWLMVYTALDGRAGMEGKRSIGAVTSDDLVDWTHVHDEPIFEAASPDAWDGGGVAAPQLVVSQGVSKLYYEGLMPNHQMGYGLGLATTASSDLSGFKRVSL